MKHYKTYEQYSKDTKGYIYSTKIIDLFLKEDLREIENIVYENTKNINNLSIGDIVYDGYTIYENHLSSAVKYIISSLALSDYEKELLSRIVFSEERFCNLLPMLSLAYKFKFAS